MAYKKYETEEEREEAKKQSLMKYKQSEKHKLAVQKSNAKVIAERKVNDEKREKYNAYQREYYARTRKKADLTDEQQKEKEEKRLEYRRQIAKRSYDRNKHKYKERTKKYYQENKETLIQKQKDYYIQHKEEIAERKRKWRLRKLMEKYNNSNNGE